MFIDTQIAVECVGHIVNSMRESGTITVVEPGKSPLNTCKSIMYGCGCTREEDLVPGDYNYTVIEPNYMFGNQKEIQRIFDKRDAEEENKYPVIILEQPFKEIPKNVGLEVNIRLLFASFVPKDDNSGLPIYQKSYKERFKPTLYPLYNKFLKALNESPIVKAYDITSKFDRPLYGETKIISSDYWDVIDSRFKITFSKSCQIEVCEQLIYGN